MTALLEPPLDEETLGEPLGSAERAAGTIPSASRTAPPVTERRPVSARQRAIYRRRRIVAAVLVLALTVLAIMGIRAVTALVAGFFSSSEATAAVAAADDPVSLGIPAGASEAVSLSPTGVDSRGVIDPPPGEAVWYTGNDRVTPGDLGTAVIVGSAAGEDGEPTAFADITTLEKGDRVVVTFGDGVTLELDVVSASLVDGGDLESSDLLWGDQSDTRRVALVTSDTVTADGDTGTFLAVAELG